MPEFTEDNKALFESKVEDNPFLDYVRDLMEERDDALLGFTQHVRKVTTFDMEPDVVDAEYVEDEPALIPAHIETRLIGLSKLRSQRNRWTMGATA